MNGNEVLMQQHREIEQAYDEFLGAEGEEQAELGKKILTDLTVHAEVEEEIYYPELEAAGETEMVAELRAEHLAAKALIAKLTMMRADNEKYAPTMKALMEAIEHHVGEEESEAMPAMAEAIGEEKLDEIGPKMEQRTEELKASTLKRLFAAMKPS